MPLSELTPFVFGTTRLGDDSIPFEARVAVAREAIDAGLTLHTSHQYGDALTVLRAAFEQGGRVPPAVFKIGWESVAQIRETIQIHLDALGIDRMAVGQLCLGGPLQEALKSGGAEIDGLRALKEEGLVGAFVLETWPWTSEAPLTALREGRLGGVADALILYFNPLQRFASDELWDEAAAQGFPIVAMRTMAGGSIDRLRAGEGYLRDRAEALAPVFARSGYTSWPRFCADFALGQPNVLATVGATASPAHLAELRGAVDEVRAFPEETRREIDSLQREWAEAHDRHAAPWSM